MDTINFGKFNITCWDLACSTYSPSEACPDDEPKLFEYYRKVRKHGRSGGLGLCISMESNDKKWLKRKAASLKEEITNIVSQFDNWWIDDGDEYGKLINADINGERYFVSHGLFYKDPRVGQHLIDVFENKDWQVTFKFRMV